MSAQYQEHAHTDVETYLVVTHVYVDKATHCCETDGHARTGGVNQTVWTEESVLKTGVYVLQATRESSVNSVSIFLCPWSCQL